MTQESHAPLLPCCTGIKQRRYTAHTPGSAAGSRGNDLGNGNNLHSRGRAAAANGSACSFTLSTFPSPDFTPIRRLTRTEDRYPDPQVPSHNADTAGATIVRGGYFLS
jgi:hypothetical protein